MGPRPGRGWRNLDRAERHYLADGGPDFAAAASAEAARPLVDAVVERLRALGVQTASGVFQARMMVSLENDGPVTLILESPAPFPP